MSVTIHGLSALNAQLTELGAELAAKALAQAARRAFKPVLDEAKRLVPRDTGALADSLLLAVVRKDENTLAVGIKIGRGRGSKQARLAAAAFGEGQLEGLPPVRRWHFIELGTSRTPAHPYLRPALDSNASVVIELLKKELRVSIEKALKKRGGR